MVSTGPHKTAAVSRRQFLDKSLGAALGAGTLTALPGCVTARPVTDPRAVGETPLKDRARSRGLLFGTAVQRRYLKITEGYVPVLNRDFNLLVAEYEMEWRILDKRKGARKFRRADKIVKYAEAHGMAMRGHSLFWHGLAPDWLDEVLRDNPEKSDELLAGRIRSIAGRYAGRMRSWDVLNEIIEPDDGRPDGLRETAFLKAAGPDYIAQAFFHAAEADPQARLVLNEYGLSWGWSQGGQRRRAMLRLLETLLAKNVPVHAVGVQGHMTPGLEGSFDQPALRRFCEEVSGMGLSLMVTEMDARDTELVGSLEYRDGKVADAYGQFLDVMLDQKALELLLVWGFSDRYSWLTSFFPRADGELVRGALYDAEFRKKPAWYAVAAALSGIERP